MKDNAQTAADAIRNAMTKLGGERSISEVEDWIDINEGRQWVDIGVTMADLVIYGKKSSTYKPEDQFLERVRRGVYRLA
jgi:hypothetical protein